MPLAPSLTRKNRGFWGIIEVMENMNLNVAVDFGFRNDSNPVKTAANAAGVAVGLAVGTCLGRVAVKALEKALAPKATRWQRLKAAWLEDEVRVTTYSGTPEGDGRGKIPTRTFFSSSYAALRYLSYMSDPWYAYTVGKTSVYEPLRKRHLMPLRKLGFRPLSCPNDPMGYDGGLVWRAYAEAYDYLVCSGLRGYQVYFLRLKLPWSVSTYATAEHRFLRYDAYILYPVTSSVCRPVALA